MGRATYVAAIPATIWPLASVSAEPTKKKGPGLARAQRGSATMQVEACVSAVQSARASRAEAAVTAARNAAAVVRSLSPATSHLYQVGRRRAEMFAGPS